MKNLSQQTIRYMAATWGFDHTESYDDINMFYAMGEYELVAARLVSAGAVEANCKEAKEMIRVAESLTHAEELDIIDACAEFYLAVECVKCNAVHFLDEYVDVQDFVKDACPSCHAIETCQLSSGGFNKRRKEK